MLGPLPPLYRVIVTISALLAFIGLGAWAAATTPLPVLASAGAGIGAALGVAVVLLLLHDPATRVPHRHQLRHRHR